MPITEKTAVPICMNAPQLLHRSSAMYGAVRSDILATAGLLVTCHFYVHARRQSIILEGAQRCLRLASSIWVKLGVFQTRIPVVISKASEDINVGRNH